MSPLLLNPMTHLFMKRKHHKNRTNSNNKS
ncbi:MAG: hypothetical protein JSR85_04735 [Proteobacteria bacterium]|nr:hypothetical protein [Pseudomonadota bacterium]